MRTWETSTAYWGADKYYQQKATRSRGTFNRTTSAWRYSFIDNYDS